jgi:hypothetical protein
VSDERRGSPRVAASLAGELETPEGKTSIAISRDIAAGGLLIFARSRPEVGTKLKLTVVFQSEQLKLEGSVLRCEDLEPGASTLWRTAIALAVDEKDPVLSRIYAALAAAPAEEN